MVRQFSLLAEVAGAQCCIAGKEPARGGSSPEFGGIVARQGGVRQAFTKRSLVRSRTTPICDGRLEAAEPFTLGTGARDGFKACLRRSARQAPRIGSHICRGPSTL